MDIITRACALYERVIVGVLQNPDKQHLFTCDERADMLTSACRHLPNVRVTTFSGLLVDFARQENVRVILRGVRGAADLDSESLMARANRSMLPGLETILLPASGATEAISSSLVRQIAALGGDVSMFVPAAVMPYIHNIMKREGMRT